MFIWTAGWSNKKCVVEESFFSVSLVIVQLANRVRVSCFVLNVIHNSFVGVTLQYNLCKFCGIFRKSFSSLAASFLVYGCGVTTRGRKLKHMRIAYLTRTWRQVHWSSQTRKIFSHYDIRTFMWLAAGFTVAFV